MVVRMPQQGEGWRHYKGDLYEIVGIGHHTETLNALVVYRHTLSMMDTLWVRPLEIFVGLTEGGRPRFEYERPEPTP